MGCDCDKAKPIPSCVTNLTIGIGEPDTDYKVVFKTPDGRIDVYDVTSDEDGNIIVTGLKVRTNTVYEIWVAHAYIPYTFPNINERIQIETDGTDVTCLYLEFHQVYNTSNIETYANQTVTLVTPAEDDDEGPDETPPPQLP